MNWVDLVILLVIIVFAIEGQRRGFFGQLIDIIGFLIALLASLTFYPQAGQLLIKIFNLPKIAANPVGFLLIWLVTETIFFAIFGGIIKKFVLVFSHTHINKYLGFIPSTINSLLFLAFVLLFVVSLPIRPDIKKDIFDSKIGSVLVSSAGVLEKPFNSIFGPIAKQSLTFLTVKPEEKGSIPLEFTQKELTVDTASEQRMLELVNQERAKFGVRQLTLNSDLTEVARAHSKDMFERGYFSHYSPEGKDVGDRLDEAGISYNVAGENLALAPNISTAHTGLMNSEGHRRNILDPAFSTVGIGAIDGGVYGKMFTQVFKD
ncbi:hypothetical protein A2165_03345 [Candidatus Curtissbacteria bacterium RBG_13_40_7]|uniref:SCP domain-containing protein n=1 Tax=Candidatus Curtissbacteria bacterium RBG_13_40_7 TaxID=1797706 RepID=A0A1F5FTM9_9BACT|nr:MAG: hypothetical protein A2165_03345 [Candidatus Curtissbacteria bacterium RBG_13_40_7]